MHITKEDGISNINLITPENYVNLLLALQNVDYKCLDNEGYDIESITKTVNGLIFLLEDGLR